MGQQKNTVVINGKTYDASSGDLVSNTSTQKPVLVSDFVKTPATSPKTTAHKAKANRSIHHLTHHKQQKSVTLKRLPRKQNSSASVTTAKSMPMSGPEIITAEAEKYASSKGDRLERAKQVSKSKSISRFNHKAASSLTKSHQALAVQPAPVAAPAAIAVPNLPTSSSSQDIFNEALSHAESHKQAPHKISRRKHRVAKKLGVSPKVANVMAVVAIVVLLGGFIAYQNATNISMKVAASRSGLASASLPGYRPSGFTLNRHVGASPGQVVLSFNSNSDSRAFKITQSSSNWDSQTLADSYLTGKDAQRIEQSNGKTVYIYGSDATWVDGGTWYRIEGNSSLTNDQLLKIANSF